MSHKPHLRLHVLALVTIAGLLVLSACAAPLAAEKATPTPEPRGDEPVQSPSEGEPAGEPLTPAWLPQAGDEDLIRQKVILDSADLLTLESFPPQFRLHLVGSLPDPCAQLRVAVGEADGQGNLPVDVYALVDPAVLCAQTITGFDESIALDGLAAGTYRVTVNGVLVGEIMMPDTGEEVNPPVDNEKETNGSTSEPQKPLAATGKVFLDSVELQRDSSTPAQYYLHLSGNLPTPCHKLKVDIQEPDDKKRILVTVSSTYDPSMMCTQVLQPFAEMVLVERPETGSYTVLVNGEEIGEITP